MTDLTITDIVSSRNTARAAFIALGDLLTTDSQRIVYHKMHQRLDKVDADLQVILTEIGGPQTFDGDGTKPPPPP